MDGLSRLERMLGEWEQEKAGHPLADDPTHRYVYTASEQFARQELNEALLNVAPELIQVARAAHGHVADSSHRARECEICQALAALARKLDGPPEEKS